MPFIKGISGNPEGKKAGTKNKLSNQLRETITTFLSENFDVIRADFDQLAPKDRAKLYCDLLQYSLPKLQATSAEPQLESLTDEQLNEIIEKLKVA